MSSFCCCPLLLPSIYILICTVIHLLGSDKRLLICRRTHLAEALRSSLACKCDAKCFEAQMKRWACRQLPFRSSRRSAFCCRWSNFWTVLPLLQKAHAFLPHLKWDMRRERKKDQAICQQTCSHFGATDYVRPFPAFVAPFCRATSEKCLHFGRIDALSSIISLSFCYLWDRWHILRRGRDWRRLRSAADVKRAPTWLILECVSCTTFFVCIETCVTLLQS